MRSLAGQLILSAWDPSRGFLLCLVFWYRAWHVFLLLFLLASLSKVACTLLGRACRQAGWIGLRTGSDNIFILYTSAHFYAFVASEVLGL